MTDHSSANRNDPQKDIAADKASAQAIQNVKAIFQLIDKTVNQRKLFPKQHENVIKFLGLAFQELKNHLDRFAKLELGINDFSIRYQNEIIFEDDDINRSLPYLFFKDGMKILYFHKDLDEVEFQDFIEIVHENSLLPPIESDVVFSLWEKDFAHISFYATDEFLETKISSKVKPKSYSLDKKEMNSGILKLKPEDEEALTRTGSDLSQGISSDSKAEALEKGAEESSVQSTIRELSQEDFQILEQMVQENRKAEDEDELISLIVEMLLLDQRPEQFSENLSALHKELDELIERGDFLRAVHIQSAVYELKKSFSLHANVNLGQVKHMISEMKSAAAFKSIREVYNNGLVRDLESFFKYLLQIGHDTLSFVRQIFDLGVDESFLIKAPGYIHKIAEKNLSAVFQSAEDAPQDYVHCVIVALGMMKQKKAVPYISSYIHSNDPVLRSDAIQAMGEIEDVSASKALIPLLADNHSDIRLLAVRNMKFLTEESVLSPILSIIEDPSFHKKASEEKRVFLKHIRRHESPHTIQTFKKLIKKPGLFHRAKKMETCLLAIEILAKSGWTSASEILNEKEGIRNKHIRSACRQARENLSRTESKQRNE